MTRRDVVTSLIAVAIAVSVVVHRPPRRNDVTKGAVVPVQILSADTASVPVVVTAEHAIESVWWRPDGHLLILTPEELVDVDPDRPLPATRLALRHGRRLRGGASGTFLVERDDGWESRDAATLERLAGGEGGSVLAISDDGRFLATATDAVTVYDLQTGEAHALLPSARDAGGPGSFTFLAGGAPGSTWAALLSAGELTLVDVLDGSVHLRRKLRRLTDNGRSRELMEVRGKRAYLTSAYGFEVVDLPRGLTLVRERDPQEGTDVTFTVSDDGATVTEASTFAETLVTSWDVPVGASVARVTPTTPPSPDESPDHRYLANLHAGTLSVVSLRSGAEALRLGPPSDAPVDMFRRLALVGGVPVLRDRRGGELPLSRERPSGPDDVGDAGDEPVAPPADMLLAAEDARFRYFVGTEHDDHAAALLPVLRVDRRTGESIPVFAAERSAVARFPDHTVEIFGDESEARASIVCAAETSWLPAASCLNLFLDEGRFDLARVRSGDHAGESVR